MSRTPTLVVTALALAATAGRLAQTPGRQAHRAEANLTAMKRGGRARRRPGQARAGDGGLGLQLRRARLPGGRDVEVPDRPAREERLHGHARAVPAFRPRGWRPGAAGKPVIALGSDIDGIPQASQKPGVAYHDRMVDGAPGHGEGHNSGMPLNIIAAIAVKKIMEREKLPGTLMLWPGVAEELVGAQGVLRARRHVQGRRRHPVHARRQQPRRVVGAAAAAPAWCRSSTPSRARRRTAPARRGAAARRSTPSS